ncbi:hypothetical protein AAC691_17155 [Nguyenibacter vanlangensis]|uniref:Relaxasome subunit MobC n=1 Tax=Nguyenibacter vanlangensis TaxID=1216886 RepID=A0ABZ3D2K1_9PROT
MSASDTLENELKRAQERLARERLAIQKIKRAMTKRKRAEKRNIEAQALCALGRGVVDFCEQTGRENDVAAVLDFMRGYIVRDSDIDAVFATLGDRRVCDAVRAPAPAMPSIEIVD